MAMRTIAALILIPLLLTGIARAARGYTTGG
jgi:hypothetical protein